VAPILAQDLVASSRLSLAVSSLDSVADPISPLVAIAM
jgi:hypothetical protein